jgi:dihydrofolate reductase
MTPGTRQVVYAVAASLDGYIAGPNGEADWIPMDPDIDFAAIFARFDTLLVGRRTFAGLSGQGGSGGGGFGMKTVVFSRTLRPADHPKVTIVADRIPETIADLKAQPGKDLWLFGGGELFHSLATLGLVDRVEVALVPMMLGAGLPLFPAPGPRIPLTLERQRAYEKSGILLLEYAVAGRRPVGGR